MTGGGAGVVVTGLGGGRVVVVDEVQSCQRELEETGRVVVGLGGGGGGSVVVVDEVQSCQCELEGMGMVVVGTGGEGTDDDQSPH